MICGNSIIFFIMANVLAILSLSRTTVLAFGLIVLALIVGLMIIILLSKQAAVTQQVLRDQQQLAIERERQRLLHAAKAEVEVHSVPAPALEILPENAAKRAITVESWGQLKVTAGPYRGLIVPLTGRQITIGRDEGDLQLRDDVTVSAQHAEIVATIDGRLRFIDKSRNGSLVDNTPVHCMQVNLNLDSIIEIGSSRIEIHASHLPNQTESAHDFTVAYPKPNFAFQRTGRDEDDTPIPNPALASGFAIVDELVVVSGVDTNKRFPLAKDLMTIGRREDQDIVLTDGFVSREHALLLRNGSVWIVRNLSTKGITIDGKPCEESVIVHGTSIAMGATVLEFAAVGEVTP